MLRLTMHGTLGGDAEVRHLDGGRAVISFSVAHTDKWKGQDGNMQERTTWVKCSLWRKSDQVGVAQYLTKGSKVYVEGTPQARPWVDKQNQARAELEITVTNVELGGGGQRTNAAPAQADAPVAANTVKLVATAQTASGPIVHNMSDDDVPF